MKIENAKVYDLPKKIYCDMDGVLADFEGKRNALKRFKNEKGFFQKLKPFKSSLQAIKRLIDLNYDVHILSASPNDQADQDKRKWLERYLPEIDPQKIILCRLGDNKADYADTKNSLLIDDYTHNLIQWRANGGQVLKYVNKRDSEFGKHIKEYITHTKDLREVL